MFSIVLLVTSHILSGYATKNISGGSGFWTKEVSSFWEILEYNESVELLATKLTKKPVTQKPQIMGHSNKYCPAGFIYQVTRVGKFRPDEQNLFHKKVTDILLTAKTSISNEFSNFSNLVVKNSWKIGIVTSEEDDDTIYLIYAVTQPRVKNTSAEDPSAIDPYEVDIQMTEADLNHGFNSRISEWDFNDIWELCKPRGWDKVTYSYISQATLLKIVSTIRSSVTHIFPYHSETVVDGRRVLFGVVEAGIKVCASMGEEFQDIVQKAISSFTRTIPEKTFEHILKANLQLGLLDTLRLESHGTSTDDDELLVDDPNNYLFYCFDKVPPSDA